MSGMYSMAVLSFWRVQPAANRSAAPQARSARLDTDHPDVDRARMAQRVDHPLLVPRGTRARNPEPEAIVREIAIENRLAQVREPARDQERRQGHGPADEHAALERDRDERGKRDHGLSAHVD